MRSTMTLEWLELRNAAVSATRWGWPVVPGTFPLSVFRAGGLVLPIAVSGPSTVSVPGSVRV